MEVSHAIEVVVGDEYMGQYDNGEWYRVRVRKDNQDGTVGVRWLDDGEKTKRFPRSKLRPIATEAATNDEPSPEDAQEAERDTTPNDAMEESCTILSSLDDEGEVPTIERAPSSILNEVLGSADEQSTEQLNDRVSVDTPPTRRNIRKSTLQPYTNYKKGEEIYRKGRPCTVVKVDRSMDPPAYVVRMSDEDPDNPGGEVGTEWMYLSRDPQYQVDILTDILDQAELDQTIHLEDREEQSELDKGVLDRFDL